MAGRWRWSIWAIVVLGHAGMLLWLAQAMRPPLRASGDEVVTYVEWFDPPAPVPVPVPDESEPDADASGSSPPQRQRPVATPSRESAPMQAVIEPRAEVAPEADSRREFVSPERDPFSRPVDPEAGRFGRRERPSLPQARRPRIAGERPPDAPLPEQHFRDRSPRKVVETIGAIIGGGSIAWGRAPPPAVEAPCGGRMGGVESVAESFSPLWRQHHGCGDEKQGASFDGGFDQPAGTVGSR